MDIKNVIKIKRELAPSPERGNARKLYELLKDLADFTNETMIVQCVEGIRHSDSKSKGTAVKEGLIYLTTAGYVVFKKVGRGKEYRIADLDYWKRIQVARGEKSGMGFKRRAGGQEFEDGRRRDEFDLETAQGFSDWQSSKKKPTKKKSAITWLDFIPVSGHFALLSIGVLCLALAYKALF